MTWEETALSSENKRLQSTIYQQAKTIEELNKKIEKLNNFIIEEVDYYQDYLKDDGACMAAIRIIRALYLINDAGDRQNLRLKSKLDSIKTLARQEVGKIFLNNRILNKSDETPFYVYDAKTIITAICNLALPEIDRDKIKQILLPGFAYRYDFPSQMYKDIEDVTDEIIKEIKNV